MKVLKTSLIIVFLLPVFASAQIVKLSFNDAITRIYATKTDYFNSIKGDSIPATSSFDRRNRITFAVDDVSSAYIRSFFTVNLVLEYGSFSTMADAEKKAVQLSRDFVKLKPKYKMTLQRSKEGYYKLSGQEEVAGGRREEDVVISVFKEESGSYTTIFSVKGGDYSKVFKSLKGTTDTSSLMVKNLLVILNAVKDEFAGIKGNKVDTGNGLGLIDEYESKICLPDATSCSVKNILGFEFVATMASSVTENGALEKYNTLVARLKKSLGADFEYDDEQKKDDEAKRTDFFPRNYLTQEGAGGIRVEMEKFSQGYLVRIKVMNNFWRL